MTKNDVLKAVCEKIEGATRKDIETILNAYSEVVTETLTNDKTEIVPMVGGIGKFVAKHIEAKEGIIQLGEHKGEKWHKDACDQLVFKIVKSAKTL